MSMPDLPPGYFWRTKRHTLGLLVSVELRKQFRVLGQRFGSVVLGSSSGFADGFTEESRAWHAQDILDHRAKWAANDNRIDPLCGDTRAKPFD